MTFKRLPLTFELKVRLAALSAPPPPRSAPPACRSLLRVLHQQNVLVVLTLGEEWRTRVRHYVCTRALSCLCRTSAAMARRRTTSLRYTRSKLCPFCVPGG